MKLLLSAYCCAPNSGSEQSFGWWWVTSCAKKHDVTVLTCEAQKKVIESYLLQNPLSITFEYVKGPKKVSTSESGYRFERLHQYLWQLKAIKKARSITRMEKFHLAHHVTTGTWRQPSCLAFCSVPFVFGPTSGSEKLPPGFVWHLGLKGIIWEKVREAQILLARFDPFVRLTLKRAATILAAGPATYSYIKSKYPTKTFPFTRAFPRNIARETLARNKRKNRNNESLTVSWSGRLLPRKGLELLLNALTDSRLQSVILCVLGDGPNKNRYLHLADKLGIKNRIHFMGHLNQDRAFEKMRQSHLFVFTSLQDMMGQSLSEAMQMGIPCVIMDWSGPAWLVGEAGAYKVPVSNYKQTCKDLANGLALIIRDDNLRINLGSAAADRMKYLTDNHRLAEERDAIYEQTLSRVRDDSKC